MKLVAALAFAAAGASTVGAADPTLPVFKTWWAKINSTEVPKVGIKQHSKGIAAWQIDGTVNKTAWVGDRGPFVADFVEQIVYFLGGEGGNTCQYTCQLLGEDACDSQLDGNALCGYDYENRAKYVADEPLFNTTAHHFKYNDPLGIISMARHDIWIDTTTGNVLRFQADFHPFGKELAVITSDYTDFSTDTPPAEYFTVQNVKYCQPGSDDQCEDTVRMMAGHRAKAAAAVAMMK